MKNDYKKPTIEINHWIVSSDDIEKLYNFFVKRFPKSNIEITLETKEGHTRICETFDEYSKEVPMIMSNHEVISKIKLGERDEVFGKHMYKQIWIDINFGEYSSASIHIIGGDIDGTYKDWIEGSYAELNKLKESFEITDEKISKILNHNYNKIIFDPDGEIHKKIIESLKPKKDTATDKAEAGEKWSHFTLKQIIISLLSLAVLLVGAWLVYKFGWN